MTRHLSRTPRLLSLDAYIHRATLGLPKAERLDAAAELRAHLLERTAEHEAQGFSREEAEFLAVKSMGDPEPVNRSLLGDALTHKAGWLALAVLLAGSGGWWAYREWMPPKEGIAFEAATPADIARLFADTYAPRGKYQAATVTYPRGTQVVVYANIASSGIKNSNDYVSIRVSNIRELQEKIFRGRVPGSYRFQERWLMASRPLICANELGHRLYTTAVSLHSPFGSTGIQSQRGLGFNVGNCNSPSLLLQQKSREAPGAVPATGGGSYKISGGQQESLPLNRWTVLRRLVVESLADPNTEGEPVGGDSKQSRGSFVAVLPLDRIPTQTDGSYSYGAGVVQLNGDTQNLPPLPPTVPEPPHAQTLP